jgi:hypothetical protein
MTKLYSATVGAGGAASVTFSNIPQGYTDLVIKASARSTRSGEIADGLVVLVNGLTTGYIYRAVQGDGSTLYSTSSGYEQGWSGAIPGSSATASIFGNTDISFANYSGFTSKTFFCDSSAENNATNAYSSFNGGMQSSPAPITSLTFSAANGTLVQNSTFTVYGIKNARQTAGNSIKATGGNIVFDGTYVYHVFNTTGAFAPTQSLTADVLVVAGGGAGGVRQGGGGGAGGVIYFSPRTLAPARYTCTVGAGGAGVSSGSVNGNNGNNSIFGAYTAAIGGGGGHSNDVSTGTGGNAGGSGGGANNGYPSYTPSGGASTQTGTGATAFYGNAGGNGSGASWGSGGGGGAGAAGQGSTGVYPAAGGVGTSAFSSWGLATGAGQNISGTYYFAGGGGSGAGGSTAVGGLGGYGGGGQGGITDNNGASAAYAGTSGTANTGGGGGATGGNNGNYVAASGSGGSGIVIVRYKG